MVEDAKHVQSGETSMTQAVNNRTGTIISDLGAHDTSFLDKSFFSDMEGFNASKIS